MGYAAARAYTIERARAGQTAGQGMSLTDKQRAFIEHYLTSWNATEAARLAGYSDKSARFIGAENLTKPNIRTEIDRRLASMAMGADEVLARLSQHASGSMEDFVDLKWGLPRINLEKAVENGKLHLIKKLTYNKEGFLQSIELHDSQAALVQLGRYHKLFTDRVEVDWRKELEAAGVDAGEAFEEMVSVLAKRLTNS